MSKNPKVHIKLKDGRDIKIELFPDIAPITVENFLKLVNLKYYDGVCFHRVINNFMIQTGGYIINGKNMSGTPGVSSIVGEFSSNGYRNTLKHTTGVISMARTNNKNSASSQFFICAADVPHLDGSYAAFGKTLDAESEKTVLEIAASNTEVAGAMFTDFPVPVIAIETVREIKD